MARKKKSEPTPHLVAVAREEIPKRIVPEIPNTFHFYSFNQNLIRMESLDKSLKIDSVLIKYVLDEIKERQLTGTSLFVVKYDDKKEVSVKEVIDLNSEELDEDLQTLVSKITTVELT